MLKSSGAMAAATMTSRVLGMVREIVYADFMGSNWVASAFFLAFTIPNLFRRLLGEGALTAAFIPLFKHKEAREGEAEMWRAANAVISGLVAAAAAITVVVIFGISVALALHQFIPKTALMLQLLQVMFPYMLLVCLAAVLIGMANARGHFFVPALGAAILNIIMIASVLFLAPLIGGMLQKKIFALAIGVLVAGTVQAFFQFPTLALEGYRYKWVSPWHDPTVREVVRKMLPGALGVAAFQVNVLVTQLFAFRFGDSIVANFFYAVRLMELPQGMFGISLATFLLPMLSGLAARKEYPEFNKTLNQGLTYLCFANLIASAIALTLAQPIVRLIFEHGKFGPEETRHSAAALACLAPGLLLFSMNNIFARAFYALDDIKTPMKISIVCLVLNLGFALWFVQLHGEAGLGLANTLSAAFNTVLLVYALRKKLSRLDLSEVTRSLRVLVLAAIAAGISAAVLAWLWDSKLGHGTFALKFGEVFIPGTVAGLLYWLVAFAFGVPAAKEIFHVLPLRRRRST